MGRRTAVVATALVLVAGSVIGTAPGAAAATGEFPTFTGVEFKEFYYASMPLPGTRPLTSRPAIYGHAGADARVQTLAEQRGYRLQATPTVGLSNHGGLLLSSEAGQAWLRLADAAQRRGTPLQGTSGYRSVSRQRDIFRSQLARAGRARIGRAYTAEEIARGAADAAIESVLAYHSIPGYSRHHTGVTMDITHAGGSLRSFAGSAAYRWISADNYAVAKSFGFIPNYPPNAGAQGPNPEPWELAYVGAENIRCAAEKLDLADPDAARICGLVDQVLVGGFDADARRDVFVYRPGSDPEQLYPGTTSRSPVERAVDGVRGSYQALVGDFDASGTDDVFWYAPGDAADYFWFTRDDGSHTTSSQTVNGEYRPLVGDFDGNGTDDIFWYAPGGAPDYLWYLRPNAAKVTREVHVDGDYRPAVGDLDGNGTDDIFWYAPGGGADYLWKMRASRTRTAVARTVNGDYLPVVGDVDGSGTEDILWYAPGGADDYLWRQHTDGGHSTRRRTINGRYRPQVGDFDGNGTDDVLWYAPGDDRDWVWHHDGLGAPSPSEVRVGGTYTVGVGDHDGDGADDVIWYGPDGDSYVWFGDGAGFVARPRSY